MANAFSFVINVYVLVYVSCITLYKSKAFDFFYILIQQVKHAL